MNLLQEYVSELTNDEKKAIITSYEQFEKDGCIGDEPIRTHAREFMKKVVSGEAHITTWMNQLAFECYRFFATKQLNAEKTIEKTPRVEDEIRITIPSEDGNDGFETFTLPSYIDQYGVRRYKRNAVIDEAHDARLFDLNKIAILCHNKHVPLKDMIIFWTMLGYSVDGMCDLSFMDPVTVVTPEWTKDPVDYNEDD